MCCGYRTGSLSWTDVRVSSHVNVTNETFFFPPLMMKVNCSAFESVQDKILDCNDKILDLELEDL